MRGYARLIRRAERIERAALAAIVADPRAAALEWHRAAVIRRAALKITVSGR